MPENIPINSVLVSSRHYADLVESDVTLNILRNTLIDRLKVWDYSGKPEIDFNGADFEDVVKALFPEQYGKKASALMADWKKAHPDYVDG